MLYNTPPWITIYKEYVLLKPYQGNPSGKKTLDEEKRVQYSYIPYNGMYMFRLPY